MGAGGSSLSLEDLSHQLAGINTALPNPKLLPAEKGQGRQRGEGSLCQDSDLSVGPSSAHSYQSTQCMQLHVVYITTRVSESGNIRLCVYVYMCVYVSVHSMPVGGVPVSPCDYMCISMCQYM